MIQRTYKTLAALAFTLPLTLASFGQAQAAEARRAASLTFAGVTYHLADAAQPSPGYVKYEYLPRGEKFPYYRNMLMSELVVNNSVGVSDLVRSQVEFLKQRKESDPVVNYDVIQNKRTGEELLDFLLSGETEDGKEIIEWNAYRYIPWRSADGAHHGVQLYGYSARAYGEDGRKFLTDLKETRRQMINALTNSSVPSLP